MLRWTFASAEENGKPGYPVGGKKAGVSLSKLLVAVKGTGNLCDITRVTFPINNVWAAPVQRRGAITF